MNTDQLISELEKPRKGYPQGVLPFERGDIYRRRITETTYTKERWLVEVDNSIGDKSCTHCPDDPRLLGRVLAALDDDLVSINDFSGADMERTPWHIHTLDGLSFGDTLLEAALKALLKKVEGEQSCPK